MSTVRKPLPKKKNSEKTQGEYGKFTTLDGRHPFKSQTIFSHVDYSARKRPAGSVAFFNYGLARQMGLIPTNHPDKMNRSLEKILLDTFAITIINEHDLLNDSKIDKKNVLNRRYMATRYLQLQNPNKRGVFSGDGRSIWNGVIRSQNGVWDVTSCGTGATCLSPATKIYDRFFETGDPYISYGCGYATAHEGLVDAVFSEMFKHKDIASERVLCVITFADGFSIKVRAGRNLLRPSHIFAHLKQSKLDRLKSVIDYHIGREVENGAKLSISKKKKYDEFLVVFAKTFADRCALFENEYIFCWMDWDGDNIMIDGGILDFGSIRQFGLFYHDYKFDDDGVWSTTIKQQYGKAKDTVASMAQAIDYVKTSEKSPIAKYKNHKATKLFKQHYEKQYKFYFFRRLGFSDRNCEFLSKSNSLLVNTLMHSFRTLEERRIGVTKEKTPDGQSSRIKYNMRQFIIKYIEHVSTSDRPFDLNQCLSRVAISEKVLSTREDEILCQQLVSCIENLAKKRSEKLVDVYENALKWNQPNRMTGDGVCVVADYLLKRIKTCTTDELYKVIQLFSKRQLFGPSVKMRYFDLTTKQMKSVNQIANHIEKLLNIYSESA